jgi:hypothetical protein
MPASRMKNPQSDPTSTRFGQRISLELPVRLEVAGHAAAAGVIRNASISGARIETGLDLQLHTSLIVKFTRPGKDASDAKELNACVVRVDSAGFGIEWRDMASVDVTELLERASGNATG